MQNRSLSVSKSLCLITGLAMLSACAVELRNKNETQSRPQVQGQGLFPLFQLKGPHYQVEVGERPNDYKLKIQPPAGTTITERVHQIGLNTERSWSLAFAFNDEEAKPGQTYEYRFLGDDGKEIGKSRMTLPIDLVVNGPYDLSKTSPVGGTESLYRYRRIFLGPQAILKTREKSLEIQAEEVFANDGAQLITFEEGDVAPAGENGKSGGELRLIFDKAYGFLKVSLRGENGGDGIAGEAYAERAQRGFEGPANTRAKHCDNLGVGGPGASGQKGRKGGAAGKGGNTGSLYVGLSSQSSFRVEPLFFAGKAGVPGKGGPGQKGGLGGVSERRSYLSFSLKGEMAEFEKQETKTCPQIPNGLDGKDGGPGDPGDTSPDGKEGLYCRAEIGQNCSR